MNLTDIENCPILYPSLKEFDNFRAYMERLDKLYKKDYGMVKIVPPKGWISRAKDYNKRLEGLVINHPIQQNTFGKGGIYECLHIPRKSISFAEFKQKSKELDKITDNLKTDQIQQMFWKNVTFSAPLYGADLLSSLMDASSKGWNLNELDSILAESLSNKVKGINTPYCYVGSWKAFFCWHTEDLDLSGVNFIHEGKSKFWYAISHQDKPIIQKEAQRLFPEHFSSCKQFLRHKTTLINPYHLKKKYPNLRISKVEHKQHQIIAVFGGSYHCGFNFGFNIAEAINYATIDWLRQIVDVKYCSCSKSSVKASVYQIYQNLYQNPKVNKTQQFLNFQEFLFKKVEAQESEQDLEEAKEGVSRQFSKKIKKAKHAPTKVTFKNEQYEISSWAQCQRCKQWRVVKKLPHEKEYFDCKKVGKQCYKKQKIDKKIFTLKS